jgi:hypothetical protein
VGPTLCQPRGVGVTGAQACFSTSNVWGGVIRESDKLAIQMNSATCRILSVHIAAYETAVNNTRTDGRLGEGDRHMGILSNVNRSRVRCGDVPMRLSVVVWSKVHAVRIKRVG